MKVFVNANGDLLIGELAFVVTADHYVWKLFNGHEYFETFKHPHDWGWEYIGELE